MLAFKKIRILKKYCCVTNMFNLVSSQARLSNPSPKNFSTASFLGINEYTRGDLDKNLMEEENYDKKESIYLDNNLGANQISKSCTDDAMKSDDLNGLAYDIKSSKSNTKDHSRFKKREEYESDVDSDSDVEDISDSDIKKQITKDFGESQMFQYNNTGVNGPPNFSDVYLKAVSDRFSVGGLRLIFGVHNIKCFLYRSIRPDVIFFCKLSALSRLDNIKIISKDVCHVRVREKEFRKVSVNSNDLIALFDGNKFLPNNSNDKIKLTLICDFIRDPVKLGFLVNIAALCGAKKVITTKHTISIWDPKVVNVMRDSVLDIAIDSSKSWERIKKEMKPGTSVLLLGNYCNDTGDEICQNSVSIYDYNPWNAEEVFLIVSDVVRDNKRVKEDGALKDFLKEVEGKRIHIPLIGKNKFMGYGAACMLELTRQYLSSTSHVQKHETDTKKSLPNESVMETEIQKAVYKVEDYSGTYTIR